MDNQISPIPITIGLMFGMFLCLEAGRWVGRRGAVQESDGESGSLGVGAVDSAIFALFGLLVAFTFSGAAERLHVRQQQIVQEANNIGTAWLRIDLLPLEAQPHLRDLYRKYLDSRLDTYRKTELDDTVGALAEFDRSKELQQEIWTASVAACSAKKDGATTSLCLNSLNDMIDITSTRAMAAKMHPPMIIFALLFALAFACAFLAGHGMAQCKQRRWAHMIAFSIVMALCIYVILDLEHPRSGFIRLTEFDKLLEETRKSMN